MKAMKDETEAEVNATRAPAQRSGITERNRVRVRVARLIMEFPKPERARLRAEIDETVAEMEAKEEAPRG